MGKFPTMSFPLGVKEEKYKGKSKQVASGAIVVNGEKVVISIDLTNKYKSKKDNTPIIYGRATNLGDPDEYVQTKRKGI